MGFEGKKTRKQDHSVRWRTQEPRSGKSRNLERSMLHSTYVEVKVLCEISEQCPLDRL